MALRGARALSLDDARDPGEGLRLKMADPRDLTIVLALKDRVEFTWRWLAYAERVALPFKVLVADGGRDEAVPRILADRSRFPNVDYEYVRYPYDASYSEYYAKLSDALNRVRTPYAVLADNDDLFAPAGLKQSLDFLAAHSDYAACGGQWALFWVSPSDGATDARVYGRGVQWKFTTCAHTEVSPRARERLRRQSLGGDDTFYHVRRTVELRRHLQHVKKLDSKDLFLFGQLVCYLCAISGKVKQVDSLYIARQHNSPGSSGGLHQETFGGWWGRMLLPTWSQDFTRFVDIASAELAAADDMSVDDARDWVVKSYRLSVAPLLLSEVLEEESVTPAMPVAVQVVRALVRLPETSWLKRALRTWYRGSRWLSFDAVNATEFLATPAADARNALEPIREFLARGQSSTFTSGT
jgi:glycosyltransferase domain-containing protein